LIGEWIDAVFGTAKQLEVNGRKMKNESYDAFNEDSTPL